MGGLGWLEEIPTLERGLESALRQKIDGKTKPLGALGRLEDLALQIGLIRGSLTPTLNHPTIVVFAGDHGVTAEGVSAYPSEVTAQMVGNFLAGGAAINVFAKLHGLKLQIVNAGVASHIPSHPQLIHRAVGLGTRNFVVEPAMSQAECESAMAAGAELVESLHQSQTDVVGFGDMGIGNTSAAALMFSLLTHLPVSRCVGPGAGLDSSGLERKTKILEKARARILGELSDLGLAEHEPARVLALMQQCMGFEMVMMTAAMLAAARRRMVILVDGFIATASALAAHGLRPPVLEYCVFAHRSAEPAHALMLDHLGAQPIFDVGMRLGEGTAAALAYPVLKTAVAFLNEMASFESAGVSGAAEDVHHE